MTTDTVTVPVSLMVFLGGIIVSMVASLLSFSGHLLISIRGSLARLVTEMAVHSKEVDGRLATLERHDRVNEEEARQMALFLRQQAEMVPHPHAHRIRPHGDQA